MAPILEEAIPIIETIEGEDLEIVRVILSDVIPLP
jgi:hypothetical protein